RAPREFARERLRVAKYIVAQPVPETPGEPFFGIHVAAREQQFRRAAVSDYPRQDRTGAHVGAGQAHAREQECGLGVRRGEAEVAGHRQDRTSPGTYALDSDDDRLRAGAHRTHEIARHPREPEQPALVHLGQGTDDLVDVSARAEIAARAGQDDGFDVVALVEI